MTLEFSVAQIRQKRGVFPGLALSVGVSLVAVALQGLEERLVGYAYVDGLVVAIVLGTLLHTLVGLQPKYADGVKFASKTVLEVAIVLLGGTISAAAVASSGVGLLLCVVGVVVSSLAVTYGVARGLGLSDRLATLVACGNSICGNSAIMATAPVIGASADDVAASIGFTAALGIGVVLLLPGLMHLLALSQWQYGVVAGLSVYAVPQVLAATAPIGQVSAQIGTLVKLIRVLMLGPVVLFVGLRHGHRGGAMPPLTVLVPWFIIGFIGMMIFRSTGFLPAAALSPLQQSSSALTIVSMAGLGLSVDLRSVFASGGRVLAAGALSIVWLVTLATLAAMALPHL
jgi:uncharacterized integral membrane protein (TIGR00698 family)